MVLILILMFSFGFVAGNAWNLSHGHETSDDTSGWCE